MLRRILARLRPDPGRGYEWWTCAAGRERAGDWFIKIDPVTLCWAGDFGLELCALNRACVALLRVEPAPQ